VFQEFWRRNIPARGMVLLVDDEKGKV